jgi:hypothetical protein
VLVHSLTRFRPETKEELFNLRHSQLRNAVERIFGVLKRRFKMAREPTEFPIKVQSQIISALCLLHNFIMFYDISNDLDVEELDDVFPEDLEDPDIGDIDRQGLGVGFSDEDVEEAEARRDDIAKQMWDDYLLHRDMYEASP